MLAQTRIRAYALKNAGLTRRTLESLESRLLMTTVASSTIDFSQYTTGNLTSFSAPSSVVAGQTLSVSVANIASNGAMSVFCSHAISVTVDGATATSTGNNFFLYDYYVGPGTPAQPEPDAGIGVSVPGGSHTVTFTIDPAAFTEQQTVGPLDSSNQPVSYSGAWVVADAPSFIGTGSAAIPFDIQGTHEIQFIQQPTKTAAGIAISPDVSVGVFNTSTGAIDTSVNTGSISIALGEGADQASIFGITTQSISNGVATFPEISIDTAGTYTLTASGDTGGMASSNEFKVFNLPQPQSVKLKFVSQPASTTVNQSLGTFSVDILDKKNHVVTLDNSDVSLALLGKGGTLEGTATVAAVSGVATFSGLSVNAPGTFRLKATDFNLKPDTSKPFKITGSIAGAHLVFDQQPTDTAAGSKVSPPVTVKLEDDNGNLITSIHESVKLSVASGPSGGKLLGSTSAPLKNGIATFAALKAQIAGEYMLATNAKGLAQVMSDTFNIVPGAVKKVVFSALPLTALSGTEFTASVQLFDQFANLATNASSAVTLSLTSNKATLGGTLSQTPEGGEADFDDLTISAAGKFKLRATDTGSGKHATSKPISVT